jgi:hypothetical protein
MGMFLKRFQGDGSRNLFPQFLFIVGHGRDGSTLLQHLVNSSSDIVSIRGENLVGLQLASMVGTLHSERWFTPPSAPGNQFGSSHPWFGVDQINVHRVTTKASEMLRQDLLEATKGFQVLGFKEIRWFDLPHTFIGMEKMLESPKFVFIERNVRDMSDSGWWRNLERAEDVICNRHSLATKQRLQLSDRAILIRYEELVEGRPIWREISSLLGIEFSKDLWEKTLREVLSHKGGRPPWQFLQSPIDLGR